MSTNIDIQNQNSQSQIGESQENVPQSPLKDPIIEVSEGGDNESSNTQNMEIQSSPCDQQSVIEKDKKTVPQNENAKDTDFDTNSNTAKSNLDTSQTADSESTILNAKTESAESVDNQNIVIVNAQNESEADAKPEDDSTANELTSESASVISSHSTKDSSDLTQTSSGSNSSPAPMVTSESSSDKKCPPKTLCTDAKVSDTDSSQSSPLDIPDDFLEEPSCSTTVPSANDESAAFPSSTYHIKWIKFKDESCPIITQNENGPCPLIAIMNVLLLQRKVKFPSMMEMVTSSQLMDYLGDCILEYAPKNISEDALLNYEQNMHDAMAVFHKLQTGLDVNVKFTGVSTFEYTSECIVFDLLAIPLYHGWLVDPENVAEVAAVGHNSYNQLVEKIITQKQSDMEETVREALIAEDFLNRTCHQLTYHGLSELAATVKPDHLCVFFRNNHFSTLYKHKHELFLLVTDQGFLTEGCVVWETLSNVEGDGHFVNTLFQTYRKQEPASHPIPPASVPEGSAEQIDQDYLVALSLQQEQLPPAPQPQPQPQPQPPQPAPELAPDTEQGWEPHLSDHELALKLQEEENHRAAVAIQRQQQAPSGGQGWAGGNHGNGNGAGGNQGSGAQGRAQARTTRADGRGSDGKKDKNGECIVL